jgi:hypothetical protein
MAKTKTPGKTCPAFLFTTRLRYFEEKKEAPRTEPFSEQFSVWQTADAILR